MSRGYPSMTALLALLAMAGYQNRDKIAGWIKAGTKQDQRSVGWIQDFSCEPFLRCRRGRAASRTL
jgi:uncharacterized protein YidB (DUF937 family)